MATRSGIGYYDKETKTLKGIYCHWDGYLENNGKILVENYQDLEKIKELIALGNLSCLGPEVNPKGPHSYNNPEKGVVIAYHRDRGEDWSHVQTTLDNDLKAIFDFMENIDGEYFYVYSDDKWHVQYNRYNEETHMSKKIICSLEEALDFEKVDYVKSSEKNSEIVKMIV